MEDSLTRLDSLKINIKKLTSRQGKSLSEIEEGLQEAINLAIKGNTDFSSFD